MATRITASRWRRGAVGAAMAATLPFTLAACAEDEPVEENIVEEGDNGVLEEEDDTEE